MASVIQINETLKSIRQLYVSQRNAEKSKISLIKEKVLVEFEVSKYCPSFVHWLISCDRFVINNTCLRNMFKIFYKK
jgi:hypothetical protein